MDSFETSEEIRQMIEKSGNSEKTTEVLTFVTEQLAQEDIKLVDYKWQSLVNHISEMVARSIRQEKLDAVDPEIFDSIGDASMVLAEAVVNKIGGLPEHEKYLLSVHFEAAKTNL